ncbi:MAG: heavy metal-responsive transcriptional regulator [Acidobacteriota bacterium]|nr:heavy metal-responsive transcriptional regulator [Acidobacteriota bacterium]
MSATREGPFRIGVVSRRAGLSIDAIRFYERRRLLRSPARSAGGYRLFREEDVDTLLFIERAQELGFSLDEIRELLSLRSNNGKAYPRVQRLLDVKLTVVARKIADLQELEKELASALDECNAALEKTEPEACPVLKGIAAKPSRRR